jgi:hypothetical protein
MKTKIFTLLFLLISAAVLQVNSQTALVGAVNPDWKTITNVKTFESRYADGKVFLHITINGNTVTKFVAVERSLDATNYEVIGFIKIYGTDSQSNLAYYFNDESPVAANLYYRLSYYSCCDEPVYGESISVIPVNENKTPAGSITTTSISAEQSDLFAGGTN